MNDKIKILAMSLVVKFPNLLPLFEEHIADNREILTHLFIADIERYTGALFLKQASDQAAKAELRAILDELESIFKAGDDDLQNPISVSFLEHFPRPNEPGGGIRKLVGPSLAAELKIIG